MAEALDAVGRVAIEEVLGGTPVADAWALEGIAEAHVREAEERTPEGLAAHAGLTLVVMDWLPNGVEALLLGRTIFVQRGKRRRMVVAILHETAHSLLTNSGMHHSHADVWCLTLALAAPLSTIRASSPTALDLHDERELPMWAARTRLAMATVHLAS